MFDQKQKNNYAEMTQPYKMWKEKPAGPEQKELDRMFDCGEANISSNSDIVRNSNTMFQQFSSKVFGVHFRKTKAKYGLTTSVINHQEPLIPPSILELGFEVPSSSSTPPIPQSSADENKITFHRPPFFTWKYTDHERLCDIVVVAVPMISGSRDIDFKLSDDGLSVTVIYTWPIALYRSEDLFKGIEKGHPKVHSFISHMLDCGITEKSKPQGSIKIDLPCRVRREGDAFKKSAVKSNETRIVLLEFAAYQKEKIIDDADTSINFE